MVSQLKSRPAGGWHIFQHGSTTWTEYYSRIQQKGVEAEGEAIQAV
jgi:hypothetical protein